MSNITYIKGNIFQSDKQTIVNTVNCVGVMGKGVALGFRLRYPEMYEKYKVFCQNKQLTVGKLWLYKPDNDSQWVLNFPTKIHWKYPSKMEYLERCDIPIEIYEYDPDAPDELFEQFKKKWNSLSPTEKKKAGIRTAKQIQTIDNALNDSEIKSMTSLTSLNGIGITTIEKCFGLVMGYK